MLFVAQHPHSCAVCGHGVSFHPITGIRTINRDNWDILAELRPAELGKFGLTKADVVVHVPWPSTIRETKIVHVTADETLGVKSYSQ